MILCDNTDGYCAVIFNSTLAIIDYINETLDILYLKWVLSLIFPTFILVILFPLVILVLLYTSSFLLYLYSHRHWLSTVVQEAIESGDPWVGGRYLVCLLWDAHGYVWHGYEVEGLEHLPKSKGCLIVYYHGALPIDAYYLTSRMLLSKGKLLRCIADRFLYNIPGWKTLLEAFEIKSGSVSSCVEDINEGNIVLLSPGGVREAQFSDHSYRLIWGYRTGFAKVALQTDCAIIPMFTENIRESFRTFSWPLWFWLYIYEKIRIPLAPVYGGFPVKLRTHLGPPIYPLPEETPEALAKRTQTVVRSLIERHQRLPGNILRALFARFYETPAFKDK